MGGNRSMRVARLRLPLAMAVVAATLLAAALPAGATIYERGEYDVMEQDDFEVCGLGVHWEGHFTGQYQIRAGRNKDAGAFFFQDRYSSLETFTNTANGKHFTISHDAVFQDLKATRVEGSVFEFVTHEAGQPFVVRDMNGKVVLRDRGVITWTYLFDTLGDDEPGGNWLAELDVRVSGPHPAFFLEPGDECPGVIDLIG